MCHTQTSSYSPLGSNLEIWILFLTGKILIALKKIKFTSSCHCVIFFLLYRQICDCLDKQQWPDLYQRWIIRLGRAWAKNGSSSDNPSVYKHGQADGSSIQTSYHDSPSCQTNYPGELVKTDDLSLCINAGRRWTIDENYSSLQKASGQYKRVTSHTTHR